MLFPISCNRREVGGAGKTSGGTGEAGRRPCFPSLQDQTGSGQGLRRAGAAGVGCYSFRSAGRRKPVFYLLFACYRPVPALNADWPKSLSCKGWRAFLQIKFPICACSEVVIPVIRLIIKQNPSVIRLFFPVIDRSQNRPLSLVPQCFRGFYASCLTLFFICYQITRSRGFYGIIMVSGTETAGLCTTVVMIPGPADSADEKDQLTIRRASSHPIGQGKPPARLAAEGCYLLCSLLISQLISCHKDGSQLFCPGRRHQLCNQIGGNRHLGVKGQGGFFCVHGSISFHSGGGAAGSVYYDRIVAQPLPLRGPYISPTLLLNSLVTTQNVL